MSHASLKAVRSRAPESRFIDLRSQMVEAQLAGHGIADPRVLDAMGRIPREQFVPTEMRDAAYEDGPLPIGFGQTISQPFTVAFMCEALRLNGTEKVLEIGAGSGYSAAVLSLLARSVFTIERVPELAEQARSRLTELGYDNVHVITGDGTLGLSSEAPFDAIVVTAGAETLPDTYVQQLRMGGRIVIPIGEYRYNQEMYRFTRLEGELRVETLGGFAFVPLIGKYGWHVPEEG
ncbi:MAG: protein-L-isoaspartate(D-aspartate) O-methyltransferase [Planctomycetia bacterium]|nr:protein-L-isoaspartate(D-aspartate) O-methyltransferase [Planctomycetia bacterium]